MTIMEAFESRKDDLRRRLTAVSDQSQSVSIVQTELSGIAETIARDENDPIRRQRAQAVLALLRYAPRLMAAASARGELVLGGDGPQDKEERHGFLRYARYAELVLFGAVTVYELLSGRIILSLLLVVGLLLLFATPDRNNETKLNARGIVFIAPDALLTELSALCHAADICLADIEALDAETQLRFAHTVDEATMSLIEVLLEARSSGREDLALRSLDDVVLYLKSQGIELAEYSEGNEYCFDMLPTRSGTRTIRPALLREGRVLRRGVAATAEGGRVR